MQVLHYVEKPSTFVSDIINCGIYLFKPEIFQHIGTVFQKNQQDMLLWVEALSPLRGSACEYNYSISSLHLSFFPPPSFCHPCDDFCFPTHSPDIHTMGKLVHLDCTVRLWSMVWVVERWLIIRLGLCRRLCECCLWPFSVHFFIKLYTSYFGNRFYLYTVFTV